MRQVVALTTASHLPSDSTATNPGQEEADRSVASALPRASAIDEIDQRLEYVAVETEGVALVNDKVDLKYGSTRSKSNALRRSIRRLYARRRCASGLPVMPIALTSMSHPITAN